MKTYRVQVICEVPRGWTRDDVLATVLDNLDGYDVATIANLNRGGSYVRVAVAFQAADDEDARAIAVAASQGLPVSFDTILDRRDRKYTRVPMEGDRYVR